MNNYNYCINILSDLITSDYILLDVPHYNSNVGDALLWQTTKDLLKNIGFKCLYECSIRTYSTLQSIPNDTTILLHPDGNFGDIWKEHQEFRHTILKDFPYNPIVQLPQSAWFNDVEYMQEDIELFRSHKGSITICLREQQSYNIIKSNYPFVKTVLLPDFALTFDITLYCKRHLIRHREGNGTLYFVRKDVEFKDSPKITQPVSDYSNYRDWPCMEKPLKIETIVKKILYTSRRFGKRFQNRLTQFCYSRMLRTIYIRHGIKFISEYQTIYTTRLHAAIIAALLDKDVHMFDNSYGKCHSLYDTWLKEMPNITKETS